MFIDPRSYHQRPSPTEAFGVFPEEMSPCFWDTSGAKKFLKVNTARDNFPYVVTTPAQHHHDSDSTNESTIDMSEDSEGEEDSIGESSSSHHQQVPDEMSLADEQEDEGTGSDDLSDGGSQNHASNQPVDESDENHSETEGAGLFIPEVATVGNASGFLIGGNALEQALIQLSPGESDSDSMSDISEDTLLQLANRGPIGKRPYCEVTTLGSVHVSQLTRSAAKKKNPSQSLDAQSLSHSNPVSECIKCSQLPGYTRGLPIYRHSDER